MATTDICTPVWIAAIIAATFVGATVASPAAIAQPDPAAALAESQEITVDAPEVVRRPGKAWEIASTIEEVNFADLDLSKAEDYATLKKRIEAAAREACRRIENNAPAFRTYSEPPGCRARASMAPLALAKQLADAAKAN